MKILNHLLHLLQMHKVLHPHHHLPLLNNLLIIKLMLPLNFR
jgi:hypothetical protein